MLPRDPASTMSRAMAEIEAGAAEARRLSRCMTMPLPALTLERMQFLQLGTRFAEHVVSVDVRIVSHTIDFARGVGTWEGEFRCRHCGGTEIKWPPTPDQAIALNLPTNSEPILAEAMCNGCLRYLGVAVALKGWETWLANFEARKAQIGDTSVTPAGPRT